MAKGSSVQHPYGVAFYDGMLYWSEFRLSKIMAVNISADETVEHYITLWEDTAPLFEIHVYDTDGQEGKQWHPRFLKGCM